MFRLRKRMACFTERSSVFGDVAAVGHLAPVDDMVRIEGIGLELLLTAETPMPVAPKDLFSEPLSDLLLLAAHTRP